MDVNQKLKELGITLPAQPEGGGTYAHVKEFGEKLAYVAGCGPELDGKQNWTGRVGIEVTVEQAQQCAEDCVKNILRALQLKFGDLSRIKSFVKMTVFVVCEHDFQRGPEVANGATKLLENLYGTERGLPVRTTVGVNALTEGFPVEIEVLVELY